MPVLRRTIRLFVSSTFSDMKAERDLLQREIFPRLRQQCLAQGLRFQPIDLRWGVSDEAGRDNRTMRICLRELRRCQSGGPKPNFLILLGDRYGWRPLPEIIPAALFETLLQRITTDHTPACAEPSASRNGHGSTESPSASNTGSCCYCHAAGNVGLLRFFGEKSENRLQWHGTSGCAARRLFLDGRTLFTQANGQVCFLQLQHGNLAISLDKLGRIKSGDRSSRDTATTTSSLGQLAETGRQTLADELARTELNQQSASVFDTSKNVPIENAATALQRLVPQPVVLKDPPSPKVRQFPALIAIAEQSHLKGNIDAAMTMYGKAFDQGAPAADLAAKWVACLLGLDAKSPIPPLHLTKARAIIDKLAAEGQKSLATDLDRQIQSHQKSATAAAMPRKPWWKVW